LAYVFNPINNTLIDDEDKSLGNKLQLMDGGRVNFANGNPNLTAAAKAANEAQKLKGLQPYIDNFGIEVLNKIAQNKHGKNFSDLGSTDLGNLKRRLNKFADFVKQNNRMPNEEEARKFGRADRDKTIFETGGEEITDEDVRNKLIKNNKYAQRHKGKLIFADKNIQNEFEAELRKRYSLPRTSTAAEQAGVLTDQQLFNKYFKPAGLSRKSVPQYISDYKKLLDLDFQELTSDQKEAKKLERDRGEKI